MKNHEYVDGRLLQTNKKYSHLKLKQKERIAAWMYQETLAYYKRTGKMPLQHHDEEVVDAVYAKIEQAGIWVPYGEVAKHYHGKRTQLCRRVKRELGPDARNVEKAVFMNMCMVCDGDRVLALDKVGNGYSGTTFPGGHVESGETFTEAVIREVREETGLTIRNPMLRGIYHWRRDGIHQIGLLYKAVEFEGTLQSSGEGAVYWITRGEYEKKELAGGMREVLRIMDEDGLTECFMEDTGSGYEAHLF